MYNSILEKEINEQPEVIHRLLEMETGNLQTITQELAGRFHYVLVAARGSSDNAARYAQYLLGSYNRLQVALATPSLFTTYHTPTDLEGAFVVGISQSGRSPDIISILEEGRRQGRPTLALTNDPSSPLAQASEYVVNLQAGIEQATAATKTYTASLAAMALFSALLSDDRERLETLDRLPQMMSQTLTGLEPSLQRVERYRYIEHCVVIGRGFNYSTAYEVSLKIKELTQIVAEPYSSADFLHGPIAMIQPGFPILLIAPEGRVLSDLRELAQRLLELRAERLIISDQPDLLEMAHLPLPIPRQVPEWLSPVVAVLPGQLFGMALAQARGLNPDRPEGIRKVTETW